MKYTNVCLKGDGTIETGKKIIKHLKILGGILDLSNFIASNKDSYYFIKREGIITCENFQPPGYILIDLPEEKPLPKWMWVWDGSEKLAVKRYVISQLKNNHYIALANSALEECSEYQEYLDGGLGYMLYPYLHAKDIEAESPLLKELETLKQRIAKIEKQINVYVK